MFYLLFFTLVVLLNTHSQYPCPAGRYGSTEGLTDAGCARVGSDGAGGSVEIGTNAYSPGCVGLVHGVGCVVVVFHIQ